MTPDDLAALLKWLYADDQGGGWLPAAARDLRLNERNLRGMLAGQVAIPPVVYCAVAAIAAAHSLLSGWQQRWQALQETPLSTAMRVQIDDYRRLL